MLRMAPVPAPTALRSTLPRSCSFAVVAFPALTVLGVLDAYAESPRQLVAQLIGSLEFLVRTRALALREHRARVRGQVRRRLGAVAQRQPEDAVHVEEQPERAALRRDVARRGETDRRLGLRERGRGVEVVRDRGRECDADRII